MAAKDTPLRFKGAPTRLVATLATAERGSEAIPQSLSHRVLKPGKIMVEDQQPLPLIVRRIQSTSPGLSLLSFRLPKSTRPGSYTASVEVGGDQLAAVIEVEARPRLRFIPPKVTYHQAPGSRARAEITLINLGNVDVMIEAESTFCVFDNRGVDRAFYRALTEKEVDGKQRIDRVMDELADAHGGLVRAVVEQGVGLLAPEEAREITVQFEFSHRIRAGQTYRGGWLVSEASLEVEIHATQALKEGGE